MSGKVRGVGTVITKVWEGDGGGRVIARHLATMWSSCSGPPDATDGGSSSCEGLPEVFTGILAEAGDVWVVMVAARGREAEEEESLSSSDVRAGRAGEGGREREGDMPREGCQGLWLPTVEDRDLRSSRGVPWRGVAVMGVVLRTWGVCI